MNSSVLMALSRHDGGELVKSADELLREIVRDVTRYGQKGKLTIEIGIEPNGEHALTMTAALKITKPKRPVGVAHYWPTEDNDITRTPPEEEDFFRIVPSEERKR